MYFLVTAIVTRTVDGWTGTVSSPTFLLDSDIQGITSTEHAEGIALRMVQEIAGPDAECFVSVSRAWDVEPSLPEPEPIPDPGGTAREVMMRSE
jgi:hypothetical protein